MMKIDVAVKYTPEADKDIPLPSYETEFAAGMDLRANFGTSGQNKVELQPQQRALIPTGLSLAIPNGYEAQIRPRSGLALKHGIALVNAPGTIDADYRGPLGVILINHGTETFVINHGDRIAQILFAPVVQGNWELVEELPQTNRGTGGFGSTGKS